MKAICFTFIFTLTVICGYTQTYTFTGNGNWSITGNWAYNSVPPSPLTSGSTIYISPLSGGSCILDKHQTISAGASLIVTAGAKFIIMGNLDLHDATPTVIIWPSVNNIGCTAVAFGNVTNMGGSAVTARGMVWSTEPNPTLADHNIIDGSGTGDFVTFLTNIIPLVTHYVRAYATNSAGTSYSDQVSFTATKPRYFLNTKLVTLITQHSAVCGGFNDGDLCPGAVLASGVVWDTLQNPTIALATKTNDPFVGQSFTSNMSGLLAGKTYYVRAYLLGAYNDTTYAAQRTFTTLPDHLPVIVTNTVTDITNVTAVSGGNITDDGQGSITARGVVWSTNPGPTTTKTPGNNELSIMRQINRYNTLLFRDSLWYYTGLSVRCVKDKP